MKPIEPLTKVIFRKFPDYQGGQVIALFPAIAATVGRLDHCESYMHTGQHGGADLHGLSRSLRLATPAEYQALAAELRRLGYRLDIRQRVTAKDYHARKQQLKKTMKSAILYATTKKPRRLDYLLITKGWQGGACRIWVRTVIVNGDCASALRQWRLRQRSGQGETQAKRDCPEQH